MEDLLEYNRRVACAEEDIRCLASRVQARTATPRQLRTYWDAQQFLKGCAAEREAELDAVLKLQVEAAQAEPGSFTGSVLQEFRWMLLLMCALTGVILLSVLVVLIAVAFFGWIGELFG